MRRWGRDIFRAGGVAAAAVAVLGTASVGSGMTIVVGGNSNFNSDIGTGNSVHVLSGGTATFNVTQHMGGLTIDSGGLATLSAGGGKVLSTGSLSVAGSGALNLTDNDAIVPGGDLTAIAALVVSGFNSGAWNGAGIRSTSAAGDAGVHTAVGVASNGVLMLTSFGGETLSGNEVLLKYTYYGDANLSGVVTGDDLLQLADGFGSNAGWVGGDFDYSGVVTGDDLLLLAENFGRLPALSTAGEAEPAPMPMPEPGSAGVLAVGGMVMLGRRRRN